MRNKLPDTWKLIPLEECMAAIIDYRGKTPKKVPFGIPLITAKIVKGGRIIDGEQEFIATDYYDNWMQRGLPQAGDIVMTTEAPLGEIAQLDGHKVALGQRLITLRGIPGILDNTFLKFLMLSDFVQNQLRARATGTTVQGIKQSELRKVTLLVPSLSEQKAIARILGSLDEKIELNRQMNKTLESMARALFKSWFVDFDPVQAKMERRQSFRLDAVTTALFPDTFDNSQLGRIPKGWSVKPLRECVIYLSRGVAPKYLQLSPIRVLNQRAIRWWNIDEEALKFHDPGKSVRKEAYIRKGDVVINSTGDITIGRAYWFYHDISDLFADSHVSIIRTSPDVLLPEMIVFQVERPTYQDIIYSHVTGSTGQLELNRSNLAQLPFLCPPIELQRRFSAIIEPFFSMIWDNKEQTRTLTSIRDALLPKLLSGEIRVKEAEKYAEALL